MNVNDLEWEVMEFKFVNFNIHHVYITILDTQASLKLRQRMWRVELTVG